ncbi:hypothetical protein NDI85_21415, partial [Halomicroarcula sp. S1AR25-4]|nr:hypothetical protein [Halomicroarcula sp. S1AR25-4]
MSDDGHQCPTCDRSFDSEIAVKIHHSKAHDESIATIQKTCQECGVEFAVKGNSKDKQYCSVECAGEARSERVTHTCEVCAETFETVPSDADGRRFCSRDCRREAFNETMVCEQCGDEFEVHQNRADERRFCSRECDFEFHRVEIECGHCEDT